MRTYEQLIESPLIKEMVNTPSTQVYLWNNSVDVLHGGKHLTYGGVSANLAECPRCEDGYWWNHAQGMKQCSTHGCHTFAEWDTSTDSTDELFFSWKGEDFPKRRFCKTEGCLQITEVDGEPFMNAVDNVCPKCLSNQIGANLNIPLTTQDSTGDKRVSQIDEGIEVELFIEDEGIEVELFMEDDAQ